MNTAILEQLEVVAASLHLVQTRLEEGIPMGEDVVVVRQKLLLEALQKAKGGIWAIAEIVTGAKPLDTLSGG